MSNTDETIREIKNELRLTMNGTASKAIKDSGAGYRLAYGTPIKEIREIADKYEKNDITADKLWSSGVREEMMIATKIWKEETTDKERIQRIAKEATTLELIKEISRNMNTDTVTDETLKEWATSDNENIEATALEIGAKTIGKRREETKSKLMAYAIKAAKKGSYLRSKTAAEYIIAYYKEDKGRKEEIKDMMKDMKNGQSMTERMTYEDVMTEIKYG